MSEIDAAGAAAWGQLKFQYPDAGYSTDGSWWKGSLRDSDDPLSAGSLAALAGNLLQREASGSG